MWFEAGSAGKWISGAQEITLSSDGDRAAVRSPPLAAPTAMLGRADADRPIRFAVGEPGRCSSVWRVWANDNKHDVYATISTAGGVTRYSFHETGTYFYQRAPLTQKGVDDILGLPPNSSKRLDEWQRPAEFQPGWTHLLSIIVPSSDVPPSPTSGYRRAAETRWVPIPVREGLAVEFQVLLANENCKPLRMETIDEEPRVAGIVDGFVLCNREIAVVTSHVVEITDSEMSFIEDGKKFASRHRRPGFSLDPSTGPRLALPMRDGEVRKIWDLSAL